MTAFESSEANGGERLRATWSRTRRPPSLPRIAASRARRAPVVDATKIIEDYRRFSASFWPGIFRISAKNFPLWSLRPSLTVGMTKIPKIPGLFHYFFCWNLRNLPAESSSEMLASFTDAHGSARRMSDARVGRALGDGRSTYRPGSGRRQTGSSASSAARRRHKTHGASGLGSERWHSGSVWRSGFLPAVVAHDMNLWR